MQKLILASLDLQVAEKLYTSKTLTSPTLPNFSKNIGWSWDALSKTVESVLPLNKIRISNRNQILTLTIFSIIGDPIFQVDNKDDLSLSEFLCICAIQVKERFSNSRIN